MFLLQQTLLSAATGWQMYGMEENVPHPGHVHFGTMKCPRMDYSRAKFADIAIIFFKNQKVKIYLQQE